MGQDKAKHILIVEDSPDLHSLLTQLFKDEGYQLMQAYNGQQALDVLRATDQLPSLILLDIMMPIMDGIEFRRLQQQDERLAHIPVVVMSADSNFKSRLKQLDVADFFQKPISDLDKLFATVDRLSS